jgi:hypothetical protein
MYEVTIKKEHQGKKEAQAIKKMIEHEISEQYSVGAEIDFEYSDIYSVSFNGPQADNFNDIYVRVVSLDDEDELEFSDFEVNVYEDVFEKFSIYNSSVKELWKQILWQI